MIKETRVLTQKIVEKDIETLIEIGVAAVAEKITRIEDNTSVISLLKAST